MLLGSLTGETLTGGQVILASAPQVIRYQWQHRRDPPPVNRTAQAASSDERLLLGDANSQIQCSTCCAIYLGHSIFAVHCNFHSRHGCLPTISLLFFKNIRTMPWDFHKVVSVTCLSVDLVDS